MIENYKLKFILNFRLFWPKNKLTTQQIQHINEAATRNFTLKLDINEIKKYIDSIYE
jgi:hypothetical protein